MAKKALSIGDRDLKGITDTIDNYFNEKNMNKLKGTKYSHYGNRESGFASFMDSEIIKDNLKHQKKLLGKGYTRFAAIDENGGIVTDSTLNLAGNLLTPDANGTYLIVDDKAVDKIKERELERRNYIENIVSDCALSDEICSIYCGMSVAQLHQMLGEGYDTKSVTGKKLFNKDLLAVDATPSAIATYDPTSITYSKALRKLKLFIEDIFPYSEKLSNEKALSKDADSKGV